MTTTTLFRIAGTLFVVMCSAAGCDRITRFWTGDTSVDLPQEVIESLLMQVKEAGKGLSNGPCRPTGETQHSALARNLLANAVATNIVDVWRPLYAIDWRDIELFVRTPERQDVLLSVMIRVKGDRCVGYSLSEVWSEH